ncbi:hypothetical protein HC891_16875 [Candidatus Gracilibacteria bacterium]|nr:hypothetical protein [Candidatus Gracilibacteria bacterium]
MQILRRMALGHARTRLVRLGFWLAVIALLVSAVAGSITRPSSAAGKSSTARVFVWGQNEFGQLGDGTNTSRPTPVALANTGDILDVAAGSVHSIALKSDGTVLAWGFNFYNQLGDGTLTNRNTPVPVSGLTDIIQVAAGGAHNLALKRDGTVWAWGYNEWGQIGDSSRTSRSTPVIVNGANGVVAIAPGPRSAWRGKTTAPCLPGEGTTTVSSVMVAQSATLVTAQLQ